MLSLAELVNGAPALATAVSKLDAAAPGEQCGLAADSAGSPCQWFEKSTKQPDGQCRCELSITGAGAQVLTAPGRLVVHAIGTGNFEGFSALPVVIGASGVFWLALGWWLWKSSRGGK